MFEIREYLVCFLSLFFYSFILDISLSYLMMEDIKMFYLDTCLYILNTAGKDSSGPSYPHAFPGMLGITFL